MIFHFQLSRHACGSASLGVIFFNSTANFSKGNAAGVVPQAKDKAAAIPAVSPVLAATGMTRVASQAESKAEIHHSPLKLALRSTDTFTLPSLSSLYHSLSLVLA